MKKIILDIEKIKAKSKLIAAQKWDGKLPKNILPENSNLLLNFGDK